MSTRRAVRVARATRTTRRTVEQQQLQYQHQQLDPSGLAGVFGFGPSSSSGGGGGGDAYSASAPSGGALLGDGSTGLDDSGRYSKRPLIRGKPTRQWIQVRRPPAPGVGFNIAVWVPVDQLTEAERSTYLPPSTNEQEAALPTDAMVVDLPLDASLALPPPADVKSVVASADGEELTTLEADPDNSAAPLGPLQQGLSDNVAVEAASHANDAIPSATTSSEEMRATAENVVEDSLLSPNDRPTKRARFAADNNEPSVVAALGEQPDSTSMEPSATERQEEEADEATTLASLAPSDVGAAADPPSGDAPTNPALLPLQPSSAASASEAPVVLSSTDSVSGRKRDLSDAEAPMGDGWDATHVEGPPPKRARPSAEEDDCPGSSVATIAKESDAGASEGAARADTDAEMTDATPITVAVIEHHPPPAIKDEHSSAIEDGLVADVDGQVPGPVTDPSLSQAPGGDSTEVGN